MRRVCPTGRRDTFSPRTWDQGSLYPGLRPERNMLRAKVWVRMCLKFTPEKWYISDKMKVKNDWTIYLLLVLMSIHKHTVFSYVLTVNPSWTLAKIYETVPSVEKHTKLFLDSQFILQKHYDIYLRNIPCFKVFHYHKSLNYFSLRKCIVMVIMTLMLLLPVMMSMWNCMHTKE